MTEEYVLLKDSNEIGKIALNKSVFSSIVNISLDEIEGVVKPEKDDHIEIKVIKNRLEITVGVIVKNDSNVKTVCENLQNKIFDNILDMKNIKAKTITVDVLGFSY